MNGTNFTRFGRSVGISVFLLAFTMFTPGVVWSQTAPPPQGCACKGSVQISLDEYCQATVTADMLLAGASQCSNGIVTIMTTPTGQPIAGSPAIGSAWVGKTLYGKVSALVGDNSCWTTIYVEDKIAPTWESDEPVEVVMTCPAMVSYAPMASDNCSIPTVYIISETIIVNDCVNPIFAGSDTLKCIERKYLAVDKSGNVSEDTCIVKIWVVGLDIDDLIGVRNIALECDANYAKLPNGNPSPTPILVNGVLLPGSGVPALYPWMPVTSGAGTVNVNPVNGNLRLSGGTEFGDLPGTGAQICFTVAANGNITFDWFAQMMGTTPPPGNYTGDHAQYGVNGGFTNLTTGGMGSGATPQSGTGVIVPVTIGQIFCFRVQTNNFGRWTELMISNIAGSVPGLIPANVSLNPGVSDCNIYITYTDTKLPTIKCVTKILRKWQILEWSCESKLIEFYQVIEIIDSKPPVITGLKDDVATTGGHACEALYKLQKPVITDNCSVNNTYSVTFPGGFFGGLKVTDPDKYVRLPYGKNEILYTAFDDCHNQSTYTIYVYVEDHTPPVAICDEWTTVGLTSDGRAWVPATSFDNGSYDECELAKLVVRRMVAPQCIKPCKTPDIPGFTLLDIIDGRHYYISNHAARPSIALKTAKALENYAVTYNNFAERKAVRDVVTAWYGNIDFIIGYTDLKLKGTYVWEATSSYLGGGGVSGSLSYVIHRSGGTLVSVNDATEYRYVIEVEDPCGFAAYTEFCCEDIGTDQMVRMRAIDKSGNWNECMVRAVIQDKLPPSITCPPHITVSCEDYFDIAKLRHHFGWATGYDNCENPTITSDSIIDLNVCRIGHIYRTFTVTDRGGRTATCSQHITVTGPEVPFTMYGTPSRWPGDISIDAGCADPNSPAFHPDVTGRPNLSADNICSLVGADWEDAVFTFNNSEGDACFKILRTWTVIDWCQIIRNDGGGISYGTWHHTQIIKVYDSEKPVITSSCEPKEVCTYDPTCTSGYIELIATAEDEECTEILRWTYKIDAFNDGSFEPSLSKSGLGNTANASGNYPIGHHRIVWSFEDRCGNLTKCEQLFSIVDCKDPTPVCLQLSTALMADPDGEGPALPMVELWAKDFDSKSYKSCDANEILLFTFDNVPMQVENKTVFSEVININTKHYFDNTGGLLKWRNTAFSAGSAQAEIVARYNRGQENTVGGGRIQLWDPADGTSATVWSSNDIPLGAEYANVNIMMTVWDEGFRHDFCWTNLKLICNTCPRQTIGRVAGNIGTERGDMVDKVIVSVDADMVEYPKSMITETSGNFEFMLPKGNDYEVMASKDTDHINGVTTLDLVLIQRHILGLQKLDSPYKLIAADANNDGRLTAADLTDLRKLILGVVNELPSNSSWRFPVTSQTMDNNNPFPFVERYNLMDLNNDMTSQNFVGVKIGDVSGNAKANNFSNTLENRSSRILSLGADNARFNTGQLVEIPFTVQKDAEISGFQFTVKFDANAFELEGIHSDLITMNDNNFGFNRLEEGIVTVSWNKDNAITVNSGSDLMVLTMKAKSNGELANAVQITSEATVAEAYTQDVEVMGVELRIGYKSDASEIVLYQNTPNPFKNSTIIGFEMPSSMEATLSIYDVTGKLVRTIRNTFAKGYNSVEINTAEIGGAGVLYYTLEASDYRATKKMVVIE